MSRLESEASEAANAAIRLATGTLTEPVLVAQPVLPDGSIISPVLIRSDSASKNNATSMTTPVVDTTQPDSMNITVFDHLYNNCC